MRGLLGPLVLLFGPETDSAKQVKNLLFKTKRVVDCLGRAVFEGI